MKSTHWRKKKGQTSLAQHMNHSTTGIHIKGSFKNSCFWSTLNILKKKSQEFYINILQFYCKLLELSFHFFPMHAVKLLWKTEVKMITLEQNFEEIRELLNNCGVFFVILSCQTDLRIHDFMEEKTSLKR